MDNFIVIIGEYKNDRFGLNVPKIFVCRFSISEASSSRYKLKRL